MQGKEYSVYGLHMTVFIGADGKIKEIVRGELTGKALKEKAIKFSKGGFANEECN